MPSDKDAQSRAVEGYFQRTQPQRSKSRIWARLPFSGHCACRSPLRCISPPLALAVVVLVASLVYLLAIRTRTRRIKVRLDNAEFTVSGDGYDIRLAAPFRCKAGVERKLQADRDKEICFIRLVIDVHGKPLVLRRASCGGLRSAAAGRNCGHIQRPWGGGIDESDAVSGHTVGANPAVARPGRLRQVGALKPTKRCRA